MGIASGSTPTSTPSHNSNEEPEHNLPPAVARSMSFRSVPRTPRNNAQFPFPHVVDGPLQPSQATGVQPYGEVQQSTATTNRTSSLATIRQSIAYLQSFDDPLLTPGGSNWLSSAAAITPVPTQTPTAGTPMEQPQQPTPIFNRGFSLAAITPVTIQTSATNPSTEETQNQSLSRESSRSGKSPGSISSIPESQHIRPTPNRQSSQATITQASFNALRESQHPPPVLTHKDSQTAIKPVTLHSVPENLYSAPPTSPSVPASTPDEPHTPHIYYPHNTHRVHHHHHDTTGTKTSFYNTTGSSFSWSTSSHEPDPRYDRLLFDYRVISQSMHAYRHISIFRRFGRLSMANLLYYQDELAGIERALTHVDGEEIRWTQTGVSESESEKQELRETRIKLMKMLQDKLKSYYEALLLQEQIFTSLEPPRQIDSRLLAALEDPSASPDDSNPFSGTANSDDLVALGLGGRDSLEKLIGRVVPTIFPHRNPSAEDLRHRNLSQKDMASILSPFTRRITRLIIAIATTALMLCPMIILQFLDNDTWKLVCISLFTIVLALLVALATRGRGEAIVMVIAAYAAVLVVFVQGNQGCGRCTATSAGTSGVLR